MSAPLIKGSDPAFPYAFQHEPDGGRFESAGVSLGMSLRQHYAGLALQGIVAGFPRSANEPDRCAAFAVQLADHLIAALNATEKPTCIP